MEHLTGHPHDPWNANMGDMENIADFLLSGCYLLRDDASGPEALSVIC